MQQSVFSLFFTFLHAENTFWSKINQMNHCIMQGYLEYLHISDGTHAIVISFTMIEE